MDVNFALKQLNDAHRRIAEAQAVVREARRQVSLLEAGERDLGSIDARLGDLERALGEHAALLEDARTQLERELAWEA